MSVIGPRPGLWNQDILTAERDKYNANDVKPGLTGWAQINGRDELEIPDKAKLDGEYVSKMGLMMDIKCFLGSVGVFAHDDSVVEGGTGEIKKNIQNHIFNFGYYYVHLFNKDEFLILFTNWFSQNFDTKIELCCYELPVSTSVLPMQNKHPLFLKEQADAAFYGL